MTSFTHLSHGLTLSLELCAVRWGGSQSPRGLPTDDTCLLVLTPVCHLTPHVAGLVCVNKASGRRDGKMVHRYWNEVIKKTATSVRLALLHAWFPNPSLFGKQAALLWAAQGQGNDVSNQQAVRPINKHLNNLVRELELQALCGALRWLRN